MRFMFGGKCSIPMVIPAPDLVQVQELLRSTHKSLEAWFVNVPGIRGSRPLQPPRRKRIVDHRNPG